jgi:hypothetical protein
MSVTEEKRERKKNGGKKIPIGAPKDPGDARDRADFIGVRFDAEAGSVLDAQEMIDDLETFGPGGIIDAADVDELLVLALLVVPQERQCPHDPARGRV